MKNRRAGFTLVELVVVIAILAILAGVGSAAYSGYIKKANQAADEQLYSEIVYAGAIGSYANPGASGKVTVTKTGAQVSSSKGYEAVVEKWLSDAFGSDWADTIKYRTDSYANNNQYSTIYLPQANVTLSEAQAALVNTFKQSSMNGHEEAVAQNVDAVAEFYTLYANGYGGTPLASAKSVLSSTSLAEEFAAKYNLTDESDAKTVANALVMYTASKANKLTEMSDGMYDYFLFSSGYSDQASAMYVDYQNGDYDEIDDYTKEFGAYVCGNDETGEYPFDDSWMGYVEESGSEIGGLGQAITLMGLAGYASSDYASAEFKAAYDTAMETGISFNVLTTLTNQMYQDGGVGTYGTYDIDCNVGTNYENYIKSGSLRADLDGSLAALQVLDGCSDQIDITDPNAFSNDSTLALLQAILGSN